MKALLSCLALALTLVTSSMYAAEDGHQNLVNPVHPDAQYVGMFTTVVTLGQVNAPTGQVGGQILVWALGGGKTEYQLKTNSIQVNGSSAILNTLSTSMIFNLLSQAAVAQGVSLGYTTPSATYPTSSANVTTVIQNSCVKRKGSDTLFKVCDSNNWGTKSYSVIAPASGSLVINLVDTDFEPCTSDSCQSTFQ